MAKTAAKNTLTEYTRLMADLAAGRYQPCYLLMGEEPYYVDKISQYIAQHVLTEEEKAFNQLTLYGHSVTAAQIVEHASRYPMMAPRQVIIVREAQALKNFDALTKYLEKPLPITLLVLCFMGKSVDKRLAFWKTASRTCEVLESNILKEEDIPSWITQTLREQGLGIEPMAAELMANFLGTSLQRVAMEIEKLRLRLPEGTTKVTVSMVEQSVGINREYSPFALNQYLSERNFAKIQPIVQYFGENAKTYPLVMLISLLYLHFSRILKYHSLRLEQPSLPRNLVAAELKMNPYFMREIEMAARNYTLLQTARAIDLLRQYDSLYKSSERGEATDGELLMELICKILA